MPDLSEDGRYLGRRHFEDEPADVRTFRAMVDMLFVSVLTIGTVRLDFHQAHDAAGAVRALTVIEIRMYHDVFLPFMRRHGLSD